MRHDKRQFVTRDDAAVARAVEARRRLGDEREGRNTQDRSPRTDRKSQTSAIRDLRSAIDP
jgi:hypothetical protein